MAKHFITTDETWRVLRGFSDDFEQPEASAICINEDGGRHFELDGVINPPMMDYNGVPLYKLDGKQVVDIKGFHHDKQRQRTADEYHQRDRHSQRSRKMKFYQQQRCNGKYQQKCPHIVSGLKPGVVIIKKISR